MPHLRALVQRMQGRPFSLFAVNSYDEEPVFRQKSEEMGVTWRSFWNGPKGTGGPISERLQEHFKAAADSNPGNQRL